MRRSSCQLVLLATALAALTPIAPACAGGTSATSGGVAGAAGGQQEAAARRYQIPAGPLAAALNRFADESGLALVCPAILAEGLRTQGVSGEYTLRAALGQLLAATGLTFQFTSINTVVIKKSSPPPAQRESEHEAIPS